MRRAAPINIDPSDLNRLQEEASNRLPQLIKRLQSLVEIESPSSDKQSVDRAIRLFAGWAEAAGAKIRLHKHRLYGDTLEARFGTSSPHNKPVLLLGHLDTVWDHGTLAKMPWQVTDEIIAGPGVLDMKAGVVMALTAIEILRDLQQLSQPVTILLHGDEEIGSPASRKITESIAQRCSKVFVLEPAQGPTGAYKTARKAVGMYRLTVRGTAAHSGVDFERGHSAIIELARQIETISSFTDLSRGITVNLGVIGGGTRSNVIAAEAWAEIDVRLVRNSDVARIDRLFKKLKPHNRHCTLELTGGINRPPMERTPATAALFRHAKNLAHHLGFDLEEAATGGGSDGNFTAALGVPTLDGMGAVGAGAHATNEHLELKHLVSRTALLAAMMI